MLGALSDSCVGRPITPHRVTQLHQSFLIWTCNLAWFGASLSCGEVSPIFRGNWLRHALLFFFHHIKLIMLHVIFMSFVVLLYSFVCVIFSSLSICGWLLLVAHQRVRGWAKKKTGTGNNQESGSARLLLRCAGFLCCCWWHRGVHLFRGGKKNICSGLSCLCCHVWCDHDSAVYFIFKAIFFYFFSPINPF